LWINIDKACDKQVNSVVTVSSHKVFDLAKVLVFEMHFMTLDGLVDFVGGSLAVSVIIVGWYHFTTEWSVQECDIVISVILWKTSEFCLHINAGQFQYQRLPLIGCMSQFPVGGPRGYGSGANV